MCHLDNIMGIVSSHYALELHATHSNLTCYAPQKYTFFLKSYRFHAEKSLKRYEWVDALHFWKMATRAVVRK